MQRHRGIFVTDPKTQLRAQLGALKEVCEKPPQELQEAADRDDENKDQPSLRSVIHTCGIRLADSIGKKLDDTYHQLRDEDARAYLSVVQAVISAIKNPSDRSIRLLESQTAANNKTLDERERYWIKTLCNGIASLSQLSCATYLICALPLTPLSIGLLVLFVLDTLWYAQKAYESVSPIATPQDHARELVSALRSSLAM